MREYRLYFLDGVGHIHSRHEFEATHDADALWLGSLLADACSDLHDGWSLWCGKRLVTERHDTRTVIARGTLETLTAERQRRALEQEELLQRSNFRVARSRRLLNLCRQLNELCQGEAAGE